MLEFFKVDCFWRLAESLEAQVEAREKWVGGEDGWGSGDWGAGPLLGSLRLWSCCRAGLRLGLVPKFKSIWGWKGGRQGERVGRWIGMSLRSNESETGGCGCVLM